MEALKKLLRDDPDYEGLPFSSTVNEQNVLNAIREAGANLDRSWVSRIRQWIQFNKACNMYEEEPYQTWVATVYSQIEALISQIENSRDDSGMQQERQSPERQ